MQMKMWVILADIFLVFNSLVGTPVSKSDLIAIFIFNFEIF